MTQTTRSPERSKGDVCEVKYVNEAQVKLVQEQMIGDEVAFQLAETFKILSDSTRVKILYALSKAELCVCDLSSLLGMRDSTVSHHLRLLRALQLVKYRKEGRIRSEEHTSELQSH